MKSRDRRRWEPVGSRVDGVEEMEDVEGVIGGALFGIPKYKKKAG